MHSGCRKLYDDAIHFCATGMSERSAPNLKERAAMMVQHAFETLERYADVLHIFEKQHNRDRTKRWTPDMPEWQAASAYHSTREYQKALSKLEGLVVARLFELQKMGLSGTGAILTSDLCIKLY
jgi:hypothetical protein